MFNIMIKQNPDGSISLACDNPRVSAKQMMTILQNMVFELQEQIIVEKVNAGRRIQPAHVDDVLKLNLNGGMK